jgi:phospholipid/cholesterol/gamma-HCH transport system ATP-binding protein
MNLPTPPSKPAEPLLVVRDLVKAFPNGTTVLNGVNLDVFPGEVFTILGGSGCGKSTLLNILIGVEEPTAGTVHVLGENIHRLPKRQRKELMRDVGVLFQSGALLQSLTVAENVALPFHQHHPKISRDRELLEETVLMKLHAVRLAAHAGKYPRELSGGMKKRAALARALALDPKLLISDEPTSGLDPVSTKEIDNLTITLSRKSGATVIVVTHDLLSFQRIATRGIMLGAERDGKVRGTVLFSGSREEFFASNHPLVRNFLHTEDGAVLVPAAKSCHTVEETGQIPRP